MFGQKRARERPTTQKFTVCVCGQGIREREKEGRRRRKGQATFSLRTRGLRSFGRGREKRERTYNNG